MLSLARLSPSLDYKYRSGLDDFFPNSSNSPKFPNSPANTPSPPVNSTHHRLRRPEQLLCSTPSVSLVRSLSLSLTPSLSLSLSLSAPAPAPPAQPPPQSKEVFSLLSLPPLSLNGYNISKMYLCHVIYN